jgi:hypothetical protein
MWETLSVSPIGYYLDVYQHVVFSGTSGEEMSLWTGGRVKAAETLDGEGGGLCD